MRKAKKTSSKVVLTRDGKGRTYDRMVGFEFQWLLQSDRLEMLLVTVSPKAETGTMIHEGEEGHYVLEGDLEIIVEGETHQLGPGDAFWHESGRAHRWRNPTDGVTRVVSVAVPRTSLSKMINEAG